MSEQIKLRGRIILPFFIFYTIVHGTMYIIIKLNEREQKVGSMSTLREYISHLNSFVDEIKDKPFVLKNSDGVYTSPLVYMVDKDGKAEPSLDMSKIDMVTLISK
jgi:hypothetical protein